MSRTKNRKQPLLRYVALAGIASILSLAAWWIRRGSDVGVTFTEWASCAGLAFLVLILAFGSDSVKKKPKRKTDTKEAVPNKFQKETT